MTTATKTYYLGGIGRSISELADSSERRPYEEAMATAVRRSVAQARQSFPDNWRTDKDAAMKLDDIRRASELLKNSLQNKPTDENPQDYAATWAPHIARMSFGSWFIERGILLGPRACFEIGQRVCSEMKFTAQEADQILKRTPKNPHEYPYH